MKTLMKSSMLFVAVAIFSLSASQAWAGGHGGHGHHHHKKHHHHYWYYPKRCVIIPPPPVIIPPPPVSVAPPVAAAPVPVAPPVAAAPVPATQAAAAAPVPVTQPVAVAPIPVIPTIACGSTYTFAGNKFGLKTGYGYLMLGKLKLPLELVKWGEAAVIAKLPPMEIAAPMPAELIMLLPDGKLAYKTKILLVAKPKAIVK